MVATTARQKPGKKFALLDKNVNSEMSGEKNVTFSKNRKR